MARSSSCGTSGRTTRTTRRGSSRRRSACRGRRAPGGPAARRSSADLPAEQLAAQRRDLGDRDSDVGLAGRPKVCLEVVHVRDVVREARAEGGGTFGEELVHHSTRVGGGQVVRHLPRPPLRRRVSRSDRDGCDFGREHLRLRAACWVGLHGRASGRASRRGQCPVDAPAWPPGDEPAPAPSGSPPMRPRGRTGRGTGAGVALVRWLVRAVPRRRGSRASGRTRASHGGDRRATSATVTDVPPRPQRTSVSPTIVLVHGAFAESASWDRVIDPLVADGHRVIAAANPLRSLAGDAAAVSDLVRTIDGPVVLAAHSYGGAVISNVDPDAGEIVGLVYVNAFAPDAGENCFGLAAMFPGSMLGETSVQPVPRSDGTTDFYVARDAFHDIFCADVPAPQAALMASTQRPATQEALTEPSGQTPLWKSVPSWFVIGEEDRIIPPDLQRYMAERARSRRTVAVDGASHAMPVSRPDTVAQSILDAAATPAAA